MQISFSFLHNFCVFLERTGLTSHEKLYSIGWTNMTKAVHPIPVHSNLHHKFRFIRLVFPLEKIYIFYLLAPI